VLERKEFGGKIIGTGAEIVSYFKVLFVSFVLTTYTLQPVSKENYENFKEILSTISSEGV
jgi:hypothetical protein